MLWDASRLRDEGRGASQQRAAQLNDSIHMRNVGAVVAFTVAGAALTTGVVTWLLTRREPKPKLDPPSPQIEVGLGQIRLSGHF